MNRKVLLVYGCVQTLSHWSRVLLFLEIKVNLQWLELDDSNWAQNTEFHNKRNITYHLGHKMNTIIMKIICRSVVLCLNKWLRTVHGMNWSGARFFSFSGLFDIKSLQYLKRMKPNMQHVPRKRQTMEIQKYNPDKHIKWKLMK